MEEQINELEAEGVMKKVLTAEVKYIIAVILFLIGIVAPYYDIKTEIALIKQNHFSHMETMDGNIEKNNQAILKMQSDQGKMLEAITIDKTKIEMLEKEIEKDH